MITMQLSEKTKLIFKIIFFVLIIGTVVMFWYDQITFYFSTEYEDVSQISEEGSNVALIKVHGRIVGYEEEWQDGWTKPSSEKVLEYINKINENEKIKAIIVEIDSGGGGVVATGEIYRA